MDKKPKKILDSFHNRSSKSFRLVNRNPQYSPRDGYDDMIAKVDHLEGELVRVNKVLAKCMNRLEAVEHRLRNIQNIQRTDSILSSVPSTVSTAPVRPTPPSSPKISTWARITKLFTQRSTLDSLKSRKIFQDEPCFDADIENVVRHERYRTIPKIVVECVQLIEAKVRTSPVEGLYRVSGDNVEIQKIRFLIDSNKYEYLRNVKNVHTIAGVLKLFLREIKSPLIKAAEIRAFIGSSTEWTLASPKYKVDILQKLVKTLPEVNRDTLCYFMRHLCRLSRMALQYSNSKSLAISIAPTIFHITLDHRSDVHTALKENEILTNCLQVMIDYCDRVFQTPGKLCKRFSRCLSCPGLTNI